MRAVSNTLAWMLTAVLGSVIKTEREWLLHEHTIQLPMSAYFDN